MKTNTARDLLLLAAVAFENKQFSEAGALFATALSSDDAPQLLETLNNLSIQEQAATASAGGEKRMSLREVSQALSAAIEETVGEGQPNVATASDDEEEDGDDELEDDELEDEDEDAEDEDEEDDEDEGAEGSDDDEDEESDDIDPDEGGETILPSSISSVSSSVAVKRKEGASQLIISGVGGVKTPIKLKQ